jgi:hypothetical protein
VTEIFFGGRRWTVTVMRKKFSMVDGDEKKISMVDGDEKKYFVMVVGVWYGGFRLPYTRISIKKSELP